MASILSHTDKGVVAQEIGVYDDVRLGEFASVDISRRLAAPRGLSGAFPPWGRLLATLFDVDVLLLVCPLLLLGLGSMAILSTDPRHSDFTAQLYTGLFGAGAAVLLSRLSYGLLERWVWWIYGLANILLLLVAFTGREALGAQRWLDIGGFSFQPSEFAKIAVILTLASYLKRFPIKNFFNIWPVLLIVAVPALLVFKQPDLGTALVFGAVTLAMLFWGGAQLSWIILLISPLVSAILFSIWVPLWMVWVGVMGVLAWRSLQKNPALMLTVVVVNLLSGGLGQWLWHLLQPYQQMRLIIFLDPTIDPLGAGYHIIQSQVAIGAGQFWGRGLFAGTQTQLNFIPEQHTDFIFSAIGEELGFIGALVLLTILVTLLWRLLVVAQNARDEFGSLLVIGFFTVLLFQTTINIGMNIGLAPVTGIPLPFVSWGRTALLSNFIAIALVRSVALQRKKKHLVGK
ncbi:rod shape-determining protein RodA [Anthocerotibacter panamensis]|uniref:rod shape-determining protein RodA n=1 Tax=Anthocerotibacter panamensis TaxID=2857077 RepID=UPI001C40246A|nr:rod shape-determining protein RodA [Anthocerotibacter panamensis]